MRKFKSVKNVMASQLNIIGLLLYTIVYGIIWYKDYYSLVFTYDRIPFWQKGNWLMIGIYALLFYIFSKAFEGNKIGCYKALDMFLADAWTILCVNGLTFLQIALIAVWPVTVWREKLAPIFIATLIDLLIAYIWSNISQIIYKKVFPPKNLLFIHGNRPVENITEKIENRNDRYRIQKTINVSDGLDKIKAEDLREYDGVMLWDIEDKVRNTLLKHFYSKSIRVYIMPKISDVIIKGSNQLYLFDIPIFMIREYALTFEERFIKRAIDIFCSLLLFIMTSPIMLITAVIIKLYDGGPVLYKQVRCTIHGKEFTILKFRSMRVDAEKDGKARLATKHDDRITPFGKIIRMIRVDELPQLINIIKGDMTFIGPRPERPELIKEYLEEMPEFAFRTKVKAGLAGYAQVYGKYNTTPYDKLKLDLSYIENYSVYLDLKLMLLTLKILFKVESSEGVIEKKEN